VLLLNISPFGVLLLNIPPLAVLILNISSLAVLLLIFLVLLLNISPLTARLAELLLNQSVRLIYNPFCSAAAQYSLLAALLLSSSPCIASAQYSSP
jgi:hypothetical protein